jgi:hypothetical protein
VRYVLIHCKVAPVALRVFEDRTPLWIFEAKPSGLSPADVEYVRTYTPPAAP